MHPSGGTSTRSPDPTPAARGVGFPGPARSAPAAFAALHHPDYRPYFAGNLLAMMADNIEHVISYWVIFQTFHSPVLGGYAIISHWLPVLLFSVYAGSLADRFDCRRLLQLSMGMFAAASIGWGVLFVSGTLQVWHAVVLLTLHGFAVVFWGPSSQLILHDVVGREHLQSAIRLNATGRQLGLLLGPAVGGALMLVLGPGVGLLVNANLYLVLAVWAAFVPYTGHLNEPVGARASTTGIFDVFHVLRAISSDRVLVSMIVLAGVAALLVGNAFQAQMPEFAGDFIAADASGHYTVLQTAQAFGAVIAGILLETWGLLAARPSTAIACGILFGASVAGFAMAPSYPVAVLFLVVTGMTRLAFSSMAQTLVQLLAPAHLRGRVIGVFNMAQSGLQVGSGVTVGLLGGIIGIHWSLALSALAVVAANVGLMVYARAGASSAAAERAEANRLPPVRASAR